MECPSLLYECCFVERVSPRGRTRYLSAIATPVFAWRDTKLTSEDSGQMALISESGRNGDVCKALLAASKKSSGGLNTTAAHVFPRRDPVTLPECAMYMGAINPDVRGNLSEGHTAVRIL